MAKYKVTCSDIEWDTEGSEIPETFTFPKECSTIVNAPDESCARDWGMDDISDNNGFLIEACKLKIEKKMSLYKAGQPYIMNVTLEIEVIPESDCGEGGMSDYIVDAILQCDDVANTVLEFSTKEDIDAEDDDSEDDESLRKEAADLWDELRGDKNRGLFPDLSPDQLQFVVDVIKADRQEDLQTYSGRAMFGRSCPGICVGHPSDVPTSVRYTSDSMGRQIILYVPN